MSQISDVYNSGLFATLAYANFSSVVGIVDAEQRKTKFKEELANKDNGEAFNDKFLTAKQAKEFADHYELFDYKEYSATGFADLPPRNSGRKTRTDLSSLFVAWSQSSVRIYIRELRLRLAQLNWPRRHGLCLRTESICAQSES